MVTDNTPWISNMKSSSMNGGLNVDGLTVIGLSVCTIVTGVPPPNTAADRSLELLDTMVKLLVLAVENSVVNPNGHFSENKQRQ